VVSLQSSIVDSFRADKEIPEQNLPPITELGEINEESFGATNTKRLLYKFFCAIGPLLPRV